MNPTAPSIAVDTSSVSLHASRRVRIELKRATDALTNLEWLGPRVGTPGEHDGLRRISTDLELAIRDGSASGPIRKSALIDIGPPHLRADAVVVEIGWQSASFTPLFPVFAGEVRIDPSGLVLDGHYAPPFGRFGLLIDMSILHLVARRTADAFLATLAARMVG